MLGARRGWCGRGGAQSQREPRGGGTLEAKTRERLGIWWERLARVALFFRFSRLRGNVK